MAKFTGKKPIAIWGNTVVLFNFLKAFDQRLDRFFAKNPALLNKLITVEDAAGCIETIEN